MSMDQIVPNLWVGDLPSALDTDTLRTHNIRSVLTAMRGRVSIHETFIRHQINLDDTEDADILQHFVPSIAFIQAELDKGWGVLVHCQAGMSRSVAIVTAYLMVTQALDAEAALEIVRKARPDVQVSKRDKETRLFYLERVVNEVMNGDGGFESDMFAKFPQSPSDTPVPQPRRRIRCKMCRQELAAREHMLDHGQLGPPTPTVLSAATSRRPSMNDPKPLSPLASGAPAPRRASASGVKPLIQGPPPSASSGTSRRPSMHDSHSHPRLGSINEVLENRPVRSALLELNSAAAQVGHSASDLLSESAVDEDTDSETESTANTSKQPPSVPEPVEPTGVPSAIPPSVDKPATPSAASPETVDKVTSLSTPRTASSSSFAHPSDLAAQLASHPKLAALRLPGGLSMTPLAPAAGVSPARSAPQSPGLASFKSTNSFAPPILANPKCSGYFVEPMKWMEPFLEQGHMAGKIVCPNKKCGAKLGNYDWAGVCCSCKEWVVPGFCIHRSKVDEVV
ncbi:hypothetical protein GSI_14928 [Ganoderma sinense ZZ0214-1]|uniref:protein-tyrosine-phosphatase n=1 Tax=Ganoderma sinense ZZ0214-1 TaxID=1077348 RepID=A0A2G8RQ21_9APHY|nr:hypothetical protein GSI_14928 [Ganoderma sinense ZZ0214-1]